MMISDWDANDGRRAIDRSPTPHADANRVSARRNHALIEIARDGQRSAARSTSALNNSAGWLAER
jgi:hypothetical protein